MSSLAGCGPSSVPAPSPSRRPNIVLISVDTLRPDHLGAYGYRRPTSPHIDSLARRGMVFDNAVSTAPWTLPAHISLLTGRYPA
ncbi:MAG: sulfatase-like hydrolase/transferase, partial [Acidobacteriota bacterium]